MKSNRPPKVEWTDKAHDAGSHEHEASVNPFEDHAKVSLLALGNLAHGLDCADASRVQALRLQVESGNYDVSADDLATKIIDSHIKA